MSHNSSAPAPVRFRPANLSEWAPLISVALVLIGLAAELAIEGLNGAHPFLFAVIAVIGILGAGLQKRRVRGWWWIPILVLIIPLLMATVFGAQLAILGVESFEPTEYWKVIAATIVAMVGFVVAKVTDRPSTP